MALLARLPHRHLVIAFSTIIATVLTLILLPGDNAEANRTAIPINLELSPKPESQDTRTAELEPEPPWLETTVKPGDSLSHIFRRFGLNARDVYEITTQADKTDPLGKLQPGQSLSAQIDEEGRLQAMILEVGPLNSLLYERTVEGFNTSTITREPEVRYSVASATIETSLYMAANNAQLPEGLIMEMANIFGGVIDFIYDVRKGDHFIVLYEELYHEGQRLGTGNILAAEYSNRGKRYRAYRYVNSRGEAGYYSSDGVSMQKAFLRAPLDFTRISSNFNPKRLHPIYKTVRPHRGTDYAAPHGTPVYAAGDGRVTAAGYSKPNGNYIFIRHGEEYETRYLHLQKRAVRKGQRVEQKQTIGWVGSTGYATGPHLHYEFLKNGVHRNPRTIIKSLPKAEEISATEMSRFKDKIQGLELQLATYAVQEGYRSSADTGSSG